MTRKEVKELLPIIKAFCDGKTIQQNVPMVQKFVIVFQRVNLKKKYYRV